MKLIYEVQMSDIIAFNQYHFRHSSTFQRNRKIFIIMTMTLCLGYFIYDGIRRHSFFPVIAGGITSALVVTIIAKFMTSPSKRAIKRLYNEGSNKNIIGVHELELTDKGLIEHSEQTTTSITWKGVERIVSTEEHTFIYLSAIMAEVIPHQRIIEGDYEAFTALLNQTFQQKNR